MIIKWHRDHVIILITISCSLSCWKHHTRLNYLQKSTSTQSPKLRVKKSIVLENSNQCRYYPQRDSTGRTIPKYSYFTYDYSFPFIQFACTSSRKLLILHIHVKLYCIRRLNKLKLTSKAAKSNIQKRNLITSAVIRFAVYINKNVINNPNFALTQ